MSYETRVGSLDVEVSDRDRTFTAPWLLDHDGSPKEYTAGGGRGVYYDLDREIVHVRNTAAGHALTFTPDCLVTVDHSDSFFEVQFERRGDPRSALPSVFVMNGGLQFETDFPEVAWQFKNTAMFDRFCAFMASPIYNPFALPVPDFSGEYIGSVTQRRLRTHDGAPVDCAYSEWVTLDVKLDRPVAGVAKRDGNDVMVPAGYYKVKVIDWDRIEGTPLKFLFYVEVVHSDADDAYVDLSVLSEEMQLGHAGFATESVVTRQTFDPTGYVPWMPEDLGLPTAGPSVFETGTGTTMNMGSWGKW